MSQTVRRQLIEISNTLRDANDLLEKLFQGVADEEMMELLTDCQNCAITMGNKIEAVYGSGLKSIHALENYCESIYQISQHLDSLSECMEIYEYTKEQLLEVQRDIEEIPDKKEIAFMPYKASMWDSLESVYLAAKEDENCETYVIPIPYFDRKADKTLGEMHYEGEEYPANIPITNWEKYNFEERLPDVIYIHNAYDDSNLVTCVHPRFFSSNLKKYTEELIYIPYFVLEEIDPNNQIKINAMKHFCFLPGIVNADRVILQSENMRQIYMNEYAKVVEAAGGTIDRKQLEEKFLGTGSPKFDKVMNTKKEDLNIPEEWLRIIKKPDGSWKKIIFYNTSVTALLQYNEKMLDKMRYVFNVFKQQQNEVALLWRPHPLIKTTIESMRPQLWEEYSKIVDQYREEGWGIYDDSSDVDRAVILCDAYYGDQSSVVQLISVCKKPILIQEVQWEYRCKPIFYDCVWIKDEILFPTINYNFLCKTNLSMGKTEIIGIFDDESDNKILLYTGIYGNNACLALIPYQACEQSILIYNDRGEFQKKIEIKNKLCLNFREEQIVERGSFIYIFPEASAMIKVHKIDLTAEYILYSDDSIKKENHGRVAKYADSVYIPMRDRPIVYEFNIRKEIFIKHEVACPIKGIDTICYDGNVFWLTGMEKGVFSWEKNEQRYKKCDQFPDGFKKNIDLKDEQGRWFSASIYYKGSVFLFPAYANMIVKYYIARNTMEMIAIPHDGQLDVGKRQFSLAKYTVVKQRNNEVLFVSNQTRVIFILDLENFKLKEIDLNFEMSKIKNNWKRVVNEHFCSNGIYDLINHIVKK